MRFQLSIVIKVEKLDGLPAKMKSALPKIALKPKLLDEKLRLLKSFSEYVNAYEVRKLLRVLVTTKLSKTNAVASEVNTMRPTNETSNEVLRLCQGWKEKAKKNTYKLHTALKCHFSSQNPNFHSNFYTLSQTTIFCLKIPFYKKVPILAQKFKYSEKNSFVKTFLTKM